MAGMCQRNDSNKRQARGYRYKPSPQGVLLLLRRRLLPSPAGLPTQVETTINSDFRSSRRISPPTTAVQKQKLETSMAKIDNIVVKRPWDKQPSSTTSAYGVSGKSNATRVAVAKNRDLGQIRTSSGPANLATL